MSKEYINNDLKGVYCNFCKTETHLEYYEVIKTNKLENKKYFGLDFCPNCLEKVKNILELTHDLQIKKSETILGMITNTDHIPTQKTCETCVYWQETERLKNWGFCNSKKILDYDFKQFLLFPPEPEEIGSNLLIGLGNLSTGQAINLYNHKYGCVNHMGVWDNEKETEAQKEENQASKPESQETRSKAE